MIRLIEGNQGKQYFVLEIINQTVSNRHLANLGLISGTPIRIVSKNKHGDYIILLRDTRLAMSEQVVSQIMVSDERVGEKTTWSLSEAQVETQVKVTQIVGDKKIRRRLMDMGLTKGTPLYLRKVAPLGDPLEISVRGYELTLRKTEAEFIIVEEF
ncbi:ferrous iron transport protein A [Vagococcus intermedius]|uniref:Ferrous iron transport protein A n=1 Tax=Vagococcus intermedius TaxID=2991418 RepID=A0AAF0CV27_9ENTE|nr:ferrous iron transport protein A [Vagococcus intermedius]WEG73555.1 ferrous iron transport protein A [Vagococcus intermedius]WEG75637.1 ferrous iron transport protein A [Vagococcus intermedius]